MNCRYKEECPSYSGWCEGPKQDFSKCVEFLITAYENTKEELKNSKRLCKVGDEIGYFHIWEFFSEPMPANPMIGGAPAGVFSKMFGIVEFADGIRRVDPTDICFCDEMNNTLREKIGNESKNFSEWIYRPVNDPIWDDLFEQIEEALGFKLFFWQKSYIMGMKYRQSGRTTADILRTLIGNQTSTPIYLERPKNRREYFFQQELIKTKRKLDAKNIISRSIERRNK